MTTERRPFGRAVDLAVYAPVSVAVEASRCLPALVGAVRERAENRFASARALGEMVVKAGAREVRRRLAEPQPAARSASPSRRAQPEVPDSTLRSADDAPPAPAGDLPIDEYESLAASQVVARLDALDSSELAVVERFERAHRHRRTVLGKIEQLQRA